MTGLDIDVAYAVFWFSLGSACSAALISLVLWLNSQLKPGWLAVARASVAAKLRAGKPMPRNRVIANEPPMVNAPLESPLVIEPEMNTTSSSWRPINAGLPRNRVVANEPSTVLESPLSDYATAARAESDADTATRLRLHRKGPRHRAEGDPQ